MNFSFVSFQRFRRLYLRRHQLHNTMGLNSLDYIKRNHTLFLSARAHVLARWWKQRLLSSFPELRHLDFHLLTKNVPYLHEKQL